MKWFILVLVALLTVQFCFAATIHGTIYDMDLRPAQKAIVAVDTVPEQVFVANDGIYAFTLPIGKFSITATYTADSKQFRAQQNMTIADNGDYVVDIILFQDISEEQAILNEELNPVIVYPEETHRTWIYVILAFALMAVAVFVFWKKRKKSRAITEPDSLPDDIIKFIKQHGGRATQKDIRRHIPMSEAKISLVLTELEAKGTVQKIKKGKGNIIILSH
jgi:LPXTG-motif cell wall-anchored protein